MDIHHHYGYSAQKIWKKYSPNDKLMIVNIARDKYYCQPRMFTHYSCLVRHGGRAECRHYINPPSFSLPPAVAAEVAGGENHSSALLCLPS